MTASDASLPHYRLKFLPQALAEVECAGRQRQGGTEKTPEETPGAARLPGAELHGELRNCYKIKLLKQGYRLVYQVEDDVLVVLVLAVAKREDLAVYRAAVDRLLAGK